MLIVLGIGLFAIVATGFGTGGMGLGGLGTGADAVAEIEGEPITSAELVDQANRQLQAAQQQNPELTMAQFLRGGTLRQILDQMIGSRALVAFGRDQGMTASKKMVDAEIAAIPAFRNFAGQFDQTAFQAALARENISEQELREDLAGSLIHQQILLPVAGSAKVPQEMARRYASLLLEQRSGSVGLVPTRAMGTGTPPSEAEIAAFYRENQSRYTIPERRVIRYATIGSEQVEQAAQATEAEIAAAYQRNSDRYGARERRVLSQVVLPDRAAAQALAAKVQAGTSFAEAAQQAEFSPEDIRVGEQDRAEFANLTSEAVANAAFSAAEGATTAPIQSPLGWHVVRVDEVNSIEATPLAAVQVEIEREIEQQKRSEALGALIARVEDALGEGSSFEEVARANGLTIRETPPVTAAGRQAEDRAWRPSPEVQALLRPAFEMAPDEDPVVETLQANERFAVLGVGRVVPATTPPLQQIAPRVRDDLLARRAAERARAVATSIAAKINAGTPPREAFAEAEAELPPVESVSARRIEIARPGQSVPPPLMMLFSLPEGKAKILAAPNGQGWFVVHHAEQTPGDAASQPGLVEATRTQFERVLGEEYADQFGRAVRSRLDVEVEDEAVGRVMRQLAPGAGQ